MELSTFSITNFRSITKAHEIKLSNISTLVWKNNEWKSNILKALNISMHILKRYWASRYLWWRTDENYIWERDFPVQKQERKGKKETIFKLKFKLSDDESINFKNEIWSYVNWIIHIEIVISDTNRPKIRIKKRWKWTKETWAKNSNKIAAYIAKWINITYIPAIRTEDHAIEIVENMISLELSDIEEQTDYINAIKKINDLQKPILNEISKKIEESLKWFIPDIKEVETKIEEYTRRKSLRRWCEILIDDWNKTNIKLKWDWVKSLVALSLLKDWYYWKSFSLIAIEEPESHLHPEAIHSLRKNIYELWEVNQVIIATHNPLFVNTNNINSNIIVSSWKAKEAKNIAEIRKILWVQTSDNLSSARFVLVVEWIEDKTALEYLLNHFSSSIKKAISNKILAIDCLKWASKLSYKLELYKTQICQYHVLLDSDNSWIEAYNKANEKWLVEPINTTMVKIKWQKEAEFEDLLEPSIYANKILTKYWINIICKDFTKSKKKWSDKVKTIFDMNGKPYDQKIENEIKDIVAESIKWNEEIAISKHNKIIFENLIKSLEKLISL